MEPKRNNDVSVLDVQIRKAIPPIHTLCKLRGFHFHCQSSSPSISAIQYSYRVQAIEIPLNFSQKDFSEKLQKGNYYLKHHKYIFVKTYKSVLKPCFCVPDLLSQVVQKGKGLWLQKWLDSKWLSSRNDYLYQPEFNINSLRLLYQIYPFIILSSISPFTKFIRIL